MYAFLRTLASNFLRSQQGFGGKNCQNELLPLTFKGPKQGFGGKNCQNGPLPLTFKGPKQGFGGKNCQNARQGKPCIGKLCLVIAAFPRHPKFYTTTTTTTTTQKDFMWLHNLARAEKHCHGRGKSVANTYFKVVCDIFDKSTRFSLLQIAPAGKYVSSIKNWGHSHPVEFPPCLTRETMFVLPVCFPAYQAPCESVLTLKSKNCGKRYGLLRNAVRNDGRCSDSNWASARQQLQ